MFLSIGDTHDAVCDDCHEQTKVAEVLQAEEVGLKSEGATHTFIFPRQELTVLCKNCTLKRMELHLNYEFQF